MAGYNGWIDGKAPVYVPMQPLLDYLDEYHPVSSLGNNHNEKRSTILNCSIHTYRKLKYKKDLMWLRADQYAIQLGVHPVFIWHNWYEITDPEWVEEQTQEEEQVA